MTTRYFAQCPICGNRADGQITIPTRGYATNYQNSVQFLHCDIDRAAYTECNACGYRAPFNEFQSALKSLSSTELEDLVTFLGEVAEHYKDKINEHMFNRCIGQLRYLAKTANAPAPALL